MFMKGLDILVIIVGIQLEINVKFETMFWSIIIAYGHMLSVV